MRILISLLFVTLLVVSCKKQPPDSATVISMQIVDRNGFSETISTKDRVAKYEHTDFFAPQPFQKVLRVYGKTLEGKSESKVTTYHQNGHIWQYLEVIDGRAHGTYKEWFPNGQLKIELQVIEGVADLHEGAQRTWIFDKTNRIWDEDGHLVAEICYEKGMLHTPSRYYYPTGQLKKIIPYFRDQIEGLVTTYGEDGSILEIIGYKEGSKEGKAIGYWKINQTQFEEQYEKDILSEGTYFAPDGSLVSEIKNGHGFQAHFTDERLSCLVEYKKGLPEGKVQYFDPKGQLTCLYYQKEGKKNGEEFSYYPKTKSQDPLRPKLCLHWVDDLLQGEVKTWYENGLQESQRQINHNKKHGTSFAWYKNGDLMLMEEYDQDKLIKGSYYKKGDKKPVTKIENGKGVATLHNGDGHFIKKVSYEKGLPLLEKDS